MKRKTKKMTDRVMSVILVCIMLLCLTGCGNAAPTIGEDVVVSTEESGVAEESSTETTEKEEKEITDGKVEDGDKPVETTASPTQTPVSTPAPTAKPTPEPTAVPEPTPTPEHVHEYTAESITTQATCATAGVKTLTCECGEVKTETVPATGNHNWVEGTTVVHHEALGHVSVTETQVQVGTTTRTEYACGVCDARFDTPQEKTEHCKATGDINHAFATTIAYDYSEPVYETRTETVWVVDQEAWDETVGTGTYTCTVCGATK